MSDSVIKHAYLENEDSDIILAFAADICDSVEKTAVATEAHAKNSWFYSVPVRRLCKAISDIAIGASIVPGNGGNCVAQTIEELMANASNLAEPMSGDAFDDAASLDDGIYPIQEEDLQVIKADMVECDDGNTVEEKLTELNADIAELKNYEDLLSTAFTASVGSHALLKNPTTYRKITIIYRYANNSAEYVRDYYPLISQAGSMDCNLGSSGQTVTMFSFTTTGITVSSSLPSNYGGTYVVKVLGWK